MDKFYLVFMRREQMAKMKIIFIDFLMQGLYEPFGSQVPFTSPKSILIYSYIYYSAGEVS